MPRGPLGPTTALGPHEKRIIRWYPKEWAEFLNEVTAYKLRVHERYRTLLMRLAESRRRCPRCRRTYQAAQDLANFMRPFVGPRKQRGSIGTFSLGTFEEGSTDCSFTASTIPNLFEFNIEPTDSYTQARLHQDGDWYWNESTNGAWGASRGTWDGDCAIADYDSRWNQISGTVPNANVSNTDGNWAAANTAGGSAVGYSRNFGIANGSFNLELRDGTSLNVLFTDAFTMWAEVDARN